MTEPAFEIIDALGLVRLTKRTPTLDGAVPLRVAQGCAPLLEGNAYGHQLVLRAPFLVSRGLRPQVRFAEPDVERSFRAALPRLVANGHLNEGGHWHRELSRGVVRASRGRQGEVRISLWTGLLVRPSSAPALVLRVTNAQNRRNRALAIEEMSICGAGWSPLVLGFGVTGAGGKDDPLIVPQGEEIASIAPLPCAGESTFETATTEDARAILARHLAFYDAAYFRDKKQGVTRKYRQTIARETEAGTSKTAGATLVASVGPVSFASEAPSEIVTSEGVRAAKREELPLSIVVRNAIGFRARYDGQSVRIDPDKTALATFAAAVKTRWTEAIGENEHPGALLYLSKYFTPHPPGEPHFFVKPPSFVATPAGWSSLVDGIPGPGYDVLRGVVATDSFHALPAVFALHDSGRWIDVPAGTPIARVLPCPRALLQAPFRRVPLDADHPGFDETHDEGQMDEETMAAGE